MFTAGMSHSEYSGRLQIAAKSIALFYTGIGLLFLLGNIFCLYILLGIPTAAVESSIEYEQWNANSESINANNYYSLTNLLKGKLSVKKEDLVTIFTITLLYFILELFVARVLYDGVKKLHLSKLQLWCDIRLSILVVNALAVCSNIYYWAEQKNYGILNLCLIALGLVGLLTVKKLMAVTDEFKLHQFSESTGTDSSPNVLDKSKATHSVDTFII